MKRNNKSFVLILFLSVVGYFSTVAFQSFPENTITGEDIYRLNCAGCHGIDREGKANIYPPLVNIKEKLIKDQIFKQVENGKGVMPAFTHIPRNEKEALVTFIYDGETEIIEGLASNIGEGIFKSNCTSCHRKFVNDPKPPNVRMMEPPPLAGITHRISKSYFYRVVENGKCYMPSFDHFSTAEKEELFMYLNSFKYQGESTRMNMRCGCSRRMVMRRN